MKNKGQLLQELDSFISFLQSLSNLPEKQFIDTPHLNESAKSWIVNAYVQDKMYLDYYFSKMNKGEDIKGANKELIRNMKQELLEQSTVEALLQSFIGIRRKIVSYLKSLPEGHMHAFFTIDNVRFTMYDHIEHIIFNDDISRKEISGLISPKE